ncbi:MAG: ribonuclease H [Pseudomonadota bacterium]
MSWARWSLRGTKVFAKVREDGTLAGDDDGRVEIRYRDDARAPSYRAAVRNLVPLDQSAEPGRSTGPATDPVEVPARGGPVGVPADDEGDSSTGARDAGSGKGSRSSSTLVVYTDGACTGNPGPMGIGIVIRGGSSRREHGEFLGTGTNNIAELTAIEKALDLIAEPDRDRAIVFHVDSSYAIGVLAGGFKAKANTALIERIRAKLRKFRRLRFEKVEGHAGVPENERCDQLARQAIEQARRHH